MGQKDGPTRRDLAISRSEFVLESTTDSVIVLDRDWRILYRNSRALELLRDRDLSLGRSLWDAFPEALEGPFHQNYKRALEHQEPVEFEEYLDSMETWFEVHAYPSSDAISLFFRDVTDRRRIHEQLTYLARHDYLTGLNNRPHFRECLEEAFAHVGEGKRVALLYVDLDQFKEVNDTFGHPFGDALLKQVAERLKSLAKDSDILARIGGDEFVVVSWAPKRVARELAETLIEAIRTPFRVDNCQLEIGASIGIAIAPTNGTSPDELLMNADLALYCAKKERGGYCFFSQEMAQFVRLRQELKTDLAGALDRDELELVYQPIYNIGTERPVAFEGLVRWHHPKHGVVMPDEFIPLAEETGLIVPIGEWVIKTACSEATNWPADVGVAVNLSPAQFRSSLPFGIADILNKAGLTPRRLLLEITESVFFRDTADNIALLEQLRDLGVRIALDDFGTGYSSLSYLRAFPFHEIKVDRSFVNDESAEALAIIDSVTKLGHALGAHVTAEGVETRQQYDRVRKVGCDKAQGFLLGRPVPSHEASKQLCARRDRTKLQSGQRGVRSDWVISRSAS